MKPITQINLCIALFLTACNGCKSVNYTSLFYQSASAKTYPPKPKDYNVPILDAAPARPYEIIGRLTFSASHGQNFMIKALKYNARRAGADAAIVLSSSSSEEQTIRQVQGYTSMVQVPANATGTTYGKGPGTAPADLYGYPHNSYGGSTAYVPVYHPGYTVQQTAIRYSIDAQMIVYK